MWLILFLLLVAALLIKFSKYEMRNAKWIETATTDRDFKRIQKELSVASKRNKDGANPGF